MRLRSILRRSPVGSGNLFDAFLLKPPGMHWSTYERKRERAERARERSLGFLADWLDRTKPAWRRRGRGATVGRD